MTIGSRIKKERTRMKIKSKEFAEMVGCHPVTQSNYETDKRIPDLEYLEKLATAGADIAYIVTGQRGPVPLTPEETALLELYRAAGPALRAAALAVLGTGSAGGVQISGGGNNVVAAGGSTVRITGAAPKPRRGKDV